MDIIIDNKSYNLQKYKNYKWWELMDESYDVKLNVLRFSDKLQLTLRELYNIYGKYVPEIELDFDGLKEIFKKYPLNKCLGGVFDKANDWAEVYNLIKNDEICLADLRRDYLNDKELMITAVEYMEGAIEHVDKCLLNDKEFMLYAVKQDTEALRYASCRLRDDREVVLEAVKLYGNSLAYASDRLKDDKKVVMASFHKKDSKKSFVKHYGGILKFASERLRDDKEVVIAAIKDYNGSLMSASERLKDDKGVVMEAVSRDIRTLQFASGRLKNDKDIKKLI